MTYAYKIIYDIKRDAWNWYDASQHDFSGFSWRNNLSDEADIKLFDEIKVLNEAEALIVLEKKIKEMNLIHSVIWDRYSKYINSSFKDKFDDACKTLEKLTGRELCIKNFNLVLTTFPRCPYDEITGEIFFYVTISNNWVDVIDNFMHEVLHFQFINYWRNNSDSPVSKLTEDEFDFLKESLAVILDDSLVPLIEKPDYGYDIHKEFRKILHENWVTHHDFDKLVIFGLSELNNYI